MTTSAPPQACNASVGQRLHGRDIGHVAGLRQAVGAAGTQLGDHGVEPPGVHVGQQQPSALRGQVSRQNASPMPEAAPVITTPLCS
jgi:hypothetical protein